MNKNPDFIVIPHQLILDKELQPADRILYGIIYWFTKLKNEKCTASNETLKELCGFKNYRTIINSLSRLEKRGYIIRRYLDEEKKKREEIIPLVTFSVSSNNDTVSSNNDTRVSSNDDQNNKSTIKRKYNNILCKSDAFAGKTVNDLIYSFKEVNPFYEKLFNNKTERKAAAALLDSLGEEKAFKLVKELPKINSYPYMPISTKPSELLRNLPKIKARMEQIKNEKVVKTKNKIAFL